MGLLWRHELGSCGIPHGQCKGERKTEQNCGTGDFGDQPFAVRKLSKDFDKADLIVMTRRIERIEILSFTVSGLDGDIGFA